MNIFFKVFHNVGAWQSIEETTGESKVGTNFTVVIHQGKVEQIFGLQKGLQKIIQEFNIYGQTFKKPKP